MSDFTPREDPASLEFVKEAFAPFITDDPDAPVLAHYVEHNGTKHRSLAAKQAGRALALALNCGPLSEGNLANIITDSANPRRLTVETRDPKIGVSRHVVVRNPKPKPWGVFGLQREAGNYERETEAAFARWCEVDMPSYDPDGKPRNLAAMNEQNCQKWQEYRPRYANLSMDKHLLLATLVTPGAKFFVPRGKDGEIPHYFWQMLAQGYEDELKSAEPAEVVFDPEA